MTGIWRGYFYSGLGFFRQQYRYEVQFNQLKNKALRGVTYSYDLNSPYYAKVALKGIYQLSAKSVLLKEDSIVQIKGLNGGFSCLMTCYLDYSKDGGKEILQGSFTSVTDSSGSDCGSGTVYLERVENSDFVKEDFLLKKPARPQSTPHANAPLVKQIPKKPQPNLITPKKKDTLVLPRVSDSIAKKLPATPVPVPPALRERKNDLVRTIITSSPDIKIDLYDNGEIDGDTITVYHNNQVIAYRKGLNTTPITLQVTASAQDNTHEFVMYANNLGKIPPNTALMVITTGGKRYELSVSSTKEKNAKVIIEYQPG